MQLTCWYASNSLWPWNLCFSNALYLFSLFCCRSGYGISTKLMLVCILDHQVMEIKLLDLFLAILFFLVICIAFLSCCVNVTVYVRESFRNGKITSWNKMFIRIFKLEEILYVYWLFLNTCLKIQLISDILYWYMAICCPLKNCIEPQPYFG